MTTLDPVRAYIAVNVFLNGLCRRAKQPGELAVFCDIIAYTPGAGSFDPAMWSDWLAAVKKLQTGVNLPDRERDTLAPESLALLDPEQAYLAMYAFIEEYWERVSRPGELGALLDRMRYTREASSADPALWQDWLVAFERVRGDQKS